MEVLEVVDCLGQDETGGFVGKMGVDGVKGIDWNGMVAGLMGGWGIGMVFESRCSINN